MKTLLNRRLIIYINNYKAHHWTCIFLFNIRNYIVNWEDIQKNHPIKKNNIISGFLCYNPASAGAKFTTDKINESGVLEFLNIIYDHCWQINKPNDDQIPDTPFPPNFFYSSINPNNRFYNMRTESVCCPKQFDSWNYGMAMLFGIMRFVWAFNIQISQRTGLMKKELLF